MTLVRINTAGQTYGKADHHLPNYQTISPIHNIMSGSNENTSYLVSPQGFADHREPLEIYGAEIRSLPEEFGTRPHGGEITDIDMVFSHVPEGMRYWAWNVMRKFMPEHEDYMLKKTKPSKIGELRAPKTADLEASMGKLKVPNRPDVAWDLEKWISRQVKQLAQFFPTPRLNISLASTEAILDHAIEEGERETELRNWMEKDGGLMENVIQEHRNTIMPALVLVMQAALMFRITKEQRAEHDRKLNEVASYDATTPFSKWIQPLIPTMKAAGWTWDQKLTFITNRLPMEMAGHNSLSDPQDLSDLTSKIQTWCTRYAKLLATKNKKTATIASISSEQKPVRKYKCERHGANNSHDTSQCKALKRERVNDAGKKPRHDRYCANHGKNSSHTTEECKKRPRTQVDLLSIASGECFRCLGAHRVYQCTEGKLIDDLKSTVEKQPAAESGQSCHRCGGEHSLKNCSITNEMIRVFKKYAGKSASLANVSGDGVCSGQAIRGSSNISKFLQNESGGVERKA